MKYIFRSPLTNRLLHAALAGLLLIVSGCATFNQETCTQFEERRKQADYTTEYRFSDSDSQAAAHNFKPMPRGAGAVVRLYKLRVDPRQIKPCHDLTLRHEIYLQRVNGSGIELAQVREFYSAGGALIASKTEILNNQLRTSGYYFGETPLPIPQHAPPGKYRVVSKLLMKTKGRNSRSVMLARTSASFQVLALSKN